MVMIMILIIIIMIIVIVIIAMTITMIILKALDAIKTVEDTVKGLSPVSRDRPLALDLHNGDKRLRSIV